MPWTTPHPWVDTPTPDVATETLLNAWRDNLLSLRNGNDQYVKLYLSDNPSIPNNVATVVSWDSVAWQVGTIYNPAQPTRLTAPVTGKYLVVCVQEWRQDTTNLRNISIVKRSATGTLVTQYDLQSQGAAGGKSNVNAKLPLAMTAGQYLEVRAFQSSGGALTLHGGTEDRTNVTMIFRGV